MKALLLDADGVVLNKGEYFSERFARDYKIDQASVIDFFTGPFVDCQKGSTDLKQEVEPFLEKWGWEGSIDDFLEYWFESDFEINKEGMETLRQLNSKGVSCYIASNNEKYRAQYIEKRLSVTDAPLSGYYFSAHIKLRKENPDFFKIILDDLKLPPEEVFFVDNEQKNVDSAASVGIQTSLYKEGILNELLNKK